MSETEYMYVYIYIYIPICKHVSDIIDNFM